VFLDTPAAGATAVPAIKAAMATSVVANFIVSSMLSPQT